MHRDGIGKIGEWLFDYAIIIVLVVVAAIAIVGCGDPVGPEPVAVDTGCYLHHLDPDNPRSFIRDTIPCPVSGS